MTNLLTVDFHGICVHFHREDNQDLDLPQAHRVVMPFVDAATSWNNETIQIHEPVIQINNDDPQTLLHTTLSLSPLTNQSDVTVSFECPPSLQDIFGTTEMVADASIVVHGGSPAGAYFDINEGTLTGIDIMGSAGVRLTIETEESSCELIMTSWDDPPTVTSTVLDLPATIVIANTSKETLSDARDDFILSFAAVGASYFPPPTSQAFINRMHHNLDLAGSCVGLLGGVQNLVRQKHPYLDLGPGCSNSHFP